MFERRQEIQQAVEECQSLAHQSGPTYLADPLVDNRKRGSREGLTRIQAERKLGELIAKMRSVPQQDKKVRFYDAVETYIRHVEGALKRKPSTVQDYKSMLRCHLSTFFEGRTVDRIGVGDIEDYISKKASDGRATNTILKSVTFHDLRHIYVWTRVTSVGTPMRTLQEWMGHRDMKTTLVYADYQPSLAETDFVERAFEKEDESANDSRTKLTDSEGN